MSFEVFLQGFEPCADGRRAAEPVLRILEPLVSDRGDGWCTITTADRETTTVYGIDRAGSGLMFSRPSGSDVWDVMFDIARAARFVVMPLGCGTCLADDSIRASLPEDIPQPVTLVRSGADILRIVTSS